MAVAIEVSRKAVENAAQRKIAPPEDSGTFGTTEDMSNVYARAMADRSEMDQFYKAVGQGGGSDPFSLLTTMANAGEIGDNAIASRTAERAAERAKWMDTGKAVASDIGKGIVEAPRQIIGGARDAVQAAMNGVGALGDWLNENVADLDALVGLKPAAGQTTQMPKLPEVKQAESVTGGVARSVAQFLTGFVGGGKVLGAAGKGVTGAAAKGVISDFSAFEGAEANLSDLIQDVPALRNPVTEFLSHEGPGDNEAATRLKRAVEGLGLGAMTEGLIRGVRAIKAARAAKAAQEAEAAPAAPAKETREALPMKLLGDNAPEAPTLQHRGDAKIELGVPDDVAARALTEKGFTPLDKNREVFINWAKINTPTEVKQVIQDVADAFHGDIDAARRGVRSNKQTVEAAAQEDAWQIIQSRRKGDPLNAEQSLAIRQLWNASATKLMEVADVAAKQPSPENLYQFRKMLATHYAVQSEAVSARTETARALQSWAIPAGGTKEQMRAIDDMMRAYGGLDVNATLAERVAALKNIPNGIVALDEIVQKSLLVKSLDTIKEVWINALLSGPKTHLVNSMSNSAVAGQQIVERFVASRLSEVVGSGKVPIGEAAAQYHGLMQSLRDAFANAGKSFLTEQSGYGLGKIELPRERAIRSANFGFGEESWIGKGIDALGTTVSIPGRALTSADEFYKTVGYRMELHAQAFRQASQDVLDGKISRAEMKSRMADIVANPPENIRMQATDAATYQTFTDAPGSWVTALNNLETRLEQHSAAGALGAAGIRFLIPFRNTPANIMKYTFERTPLAPLMGRYRDAIAQGGAAADIARTRMALGTMTMLLATDLAMDGHLTGSGPDKDEKGHRAALMRSGWQPYSVKVGDRFYSYSRLDPIGFTLGLGADLGEYINNMDTEADAAGIEKAFKAGAMSIGNNILSKSYMRGVAAFVAAMQGSDSQMSRYVDQMGGSFMPTGAAEIARSIDPYMRASHDILTKLKSRTPGLSQDLPVLRDLYGRPRTYESGLGKSYDAISPVYSRKEDIQPADRAMMEMSEYIGMPSNRVGGKKLADRPDVFSRYLELQGQKTPQELGDIKLAGKYGDKNLLDTLNDIVTGQHKLSKQFEEGDASDRIKLLRTAATDFRKAARTKLISEYPKVFGRGD